MSQVGFTPIQIYRSSTAATLPVAGNLAPGELAINTTDEKLYFENTGGTVTLLASSAAAGGTFTTVTATTVVNGLGLVGTPSYTFTGDLNTGMWSPAADTLAFSTAGSERLRIDSSGRLLVGIGSPIGISTVPVQSPRGFISADDAAGLRLLNSAQNGGGSVFANTGSNGGISIGSDAGPMLFVSTTERMRIDSAGNVGIGTTAPSAKLDVVAAAFTGGPLIGARYNTANFRMGIGIANANGFPFVGQNVNNSADDNGTFDLNGRASRLRMDSGTFQFETSSASGTAGNAITWNNSAYLDASGNLGIGVTPSAWVTYPAMQLAGGGIMGAGSDLNLSANGYFNAGWKRIATGEATLYNQSAGVHSWFNAISSTAGTAISLNERMRLDASGNLGIGTSAPTARLGVRGPMVVPAAGFKEVASFLGTDAQAEGNGAGIILGGVFTGTSVTAFAQVAGLKENSTDNNFAGYLAFYTRPNGVTLTEKMRITSAGNVLVGTTTTPGTPNARIVAGGTADAGIQISSSNGGGALILSINGVAGAAFYTHTGAVGSEAYTERMRLNANGSFGIGTTTPGGRLSVVSTSSTNLLVAKEGLPETYNPATFSSKNAYMPSGVQENWNAGSSASTVAGYLVDITAYNGAEATDVYFGAAAGPSVTGGPANFVFGRRTGIQAWAETMRIDSTGALLVGTTSATGVATNTAKLIGGVFATVRSSLSVASATPTTIVTLPSGDGIYIVSAALSASTDPANYCETAIVSTSGSNSSIAILVNAAVVSLSMSGLNLQVTQNQGATQTMQFSVLRIN